MKFFLYVCLVALYLLHNDFWLWKDSSLFWGIPSGLLYHIVFCVIATILMTALTRYAWPEDLEVDSEKRSTL